LRQPSAIPPQKALDLVALLAYDRQRRVGNIHQQNHLNRWIGSRSVPGCPIDRPKGKDRPRFLVIEQREVFLFETGNGLSRIIDYHDIEFDLAFGRARCEWRTMGEDRVISILLRLVWGG
jgi:hypothetical protein